MKGAIRVSVLAFLISVFLVKTLFAGDDLFNSLARELLKAVEQETGKKPNPQTGIISADTSYRTEWTNPDGSKSQTIVTFFGNIRSGGRIGYYAEDPRNRLFGKYKNNRSFFNGYWVQESSDQKCYKIIDGSQYYGRVWFEMKSSGHFQGSWGYCDDKPSLGWNGWRKAESSTKTVPNKNESTKAQVKQIQEGLNYFGYNAGAPDGLAGKNTRSAIQELQICWNNVDPGERVIPARKQWGKFSPEELNFFIKHYYTTSTMRPRVYFENYQEFGKTDSYTACDYFNEIVLEQSAYNNEATTNEIVLGDCSMEGDPTEPLFYCTFGGGKKQVSICSELDENAASEEDRNSLSYNFGKVNNTPDMYLLDRIENVLHPTENYSSENIPLDTENQFIFKNEPTSYVLKTESFLHSKGRAFSASLGVMQGKRVLANLDCDEGSIIDNTWDGALLEQMVGPFGQSICEGKTKGYGMINTGIAVERPSPSRGDDWVETMISNPYGYLFLGVDGSEEARFSLEGFEQSMRLTQLNSKSLADGMSPLETCFEEWCSVCDKMWPGGDPSDQLCYTIHDVNKSGLIPSFDLYGRAAIQEECYPKLSYPCSFAGRKGNKIAVEMTISEHNGSGAKIFETGPAQWHLRCEH